MLEKTMSEIITRFPSEVWPDLDLTFVERESRLKGGNILDLHFRDRDGTHWIVELKRDRVTPSAVLQLVGYLEQLRTREPSISFRGMVVAPSITAKGRNEASLRDIICRTVDEQSLRRIAKSNGLPLDHESRHRPKLAGTPRVRSRVPKRLGNRPATSEHDKELLRALDERFRPGSLDNESCIDELKEYWDLATPTAPHNVREIAARLTYEVLQALPGSAVGNRSQGKKESYTTVRGRDGRVAAAIDARKSYVKFDFPLPDAVGQRCRDEGLLRVSRSRGYSVWCLSRVGATMPLQKATELLRTGLASEFEV
jgi:hypothetical protein